ncbi:MAG: LegC family aminotransferase [Salibacteraceae bacterium]
MKDFKKFTDFVRETYQVPTEFIPLHPPYFNGNEKKYLNECIDSTFVSSVGKFVNQFEEMVAKFTGAKYAIAASNGTAALHMALILAEVQPKDEVLSQALTFVATANAISYANATPVFIDVDKDTMGMSPTALSDFLKNNTVLDTHPVTGKKQPKNNTTGNFITTCVPMHTFGHPLRIDQIKSICDEYNITLLEDAAESLGSYYKGKHTGTFGEIGTLSFNGNKTITTGGGGMLITNNEALAKKAKHLTTTAKVPHKWHYIHDHIGYNYRLTNLAAALGVAQMEQLKYILERKKVLAKQYQEFFSSEKMEFVSQKANSEVNYWLNAVICENKTEQQEFLEFTNNQGVMTRPIWELMNRLEMFKNAPKGDLSNSEWLADRVVNIPSGVM